MKRIFLLFGLIAALFFNQLRVQAQSALNGIKADIRSGNALSLGKYIAKSVDINLYDEDFSTNQNDAVQKLSSFFEGVETKGFIIKHEGDAPDGSKFIIGSLATNKGNFRTYVLIKEDKIHELSFEQ